MSDPKYPEIGDMHIDASDITPRDITPDDVKKLTKVRDGFKEAAKKVINLKKADVDRAGLNAEDIKRLADAVEREERHEKLVPASAKMHELLHEDRQLNRHDIATLMAEMAAQAKRRAERVHNPGEVLGPLDTLMEYQYGPAKKAVATKEKAKASKDEG